jgi:HAD superfamily hydrolase (TIGR01549 family)
VIRGVIFDLDGTLVDSRLDFDAMRREMELPPQMPILEALERLPAPHAQRCQEILHRHELAGAERAALLPGVAELIEVLNARGIRQAIVTRNSRQITDITLHRVRLPIELAVTRDDGPIKPDPWAILHVCAQWGIPPHEAAMIGDYKFDVECGRAAGSRTVLLTHPHDPETYPNVEQADLLLASLAEYFKLLAWLDSL